MGMPGKNVTFIKSMSNFIFLMSVVFTEVINTNKNLSDNYRFQPINPSMIKTIGNIYVLLTLTMPNFFKWNNPLDIFGTAHYHFLVYQDENVKLVEPGQTAGMCSLVWLNTGDKGYQYQQYKC